jgi:bifunctional DNA-binding transcriptional regulator/antitoxin component of YhaV-PrlF toxin-antitoxin module
MREEVALVEVDGRGRVQIPLPLRKALKIEPGNIIRIKVSLVSDMENGKSENPCQAHTLEPIFA